MLIWPDTIVQGRSTCCYVTRPTKIVVSFTSFHCRMPCGMETPWNTWVKNSEHDFKWLNMRGTQISSTIAWVPVLFRYWDLNNVVDTITFKWSNEGRTFLLKAEYVSFVNLNHRKSNKLIWSKMGHFHGFVLLVKMTGANTTRKMSCVFMPCLRRWDSRKNFYVKGCSSTIIHDAQL